MHRIGQVFNNVSSSYKFYWLIAILRRLQKEDAQTISFTSLIAQMIAEAWFPVHYFHLSFGKTDSLYREIVRLQSFTGITIDQNKEDITQKLIDLSFSNPEVRKSIAIFKRNVPFRFLSPWIPFTSDNDVIIASAEYTNNCPYSILKKEDDSYIRLHPLWKDYLEKNFQILISYCYWHLSNFMEKNNPNVPNIIGKINRPEERLPLTQQREYWNMVIGDNPGIHCIYTGKVISSNDFDLDHFIPWSFVSHDLMWNLSPVDKATNISKSNKLPNLESYLPKIASVQQMALKTIYKLDPSNRLLEDYVNMDASISELVNMDTQSFLNLYSHTITPIYHIAEKMGYEKWLR